MKVNEDFLNLLKNLIQEEIEKRQPLLESLVPTEGSLLVESKIKKILKEKSNG